MDICDIFMAPDRGHAINITGFYRFERSSRYGLVLVCCAREDPDMQIVGGYSSFQNFYRLDEIEPHQPSPWPAETVAKHRSDWSERVAREDTVLTESEAPRTFSRILPRSAHERLELEARILARQRDPLLDQEESRPMQICDCATVVETRERVRITGFYRLGATPGGKLQLLCCEPDHPEMEIVGSYAICGQFHRVEELEAGPTVSWSQELIDEERDLWNRMVAAAEVALTEREYPEVFRRHGPRSAHERLAIIERSNRRREAAGS